MGNNGSSPGARPRSPTVASRPLVAAQRTQSLPVCHYAQHVVRHSRNCHVCRDQFPRCRAAAAADSSAPSFRSTSRFRRALPNLVSNVSTAIGQKLSWTNGGGSGKMIDKSHVGVRQPPSHHSVGSGGKSDKRSRSRTREHCRLFRELVNNWRLTDLHCLVVEFESAFAVRELAKRADAARPAAASLKDDLASLYRETNASNRVRGGDDPSADAVLVLDDHSFAVHRAFLSKRCPFFRYLFVADGSSGDTSRLGDEYNWRPTVPVIFPASITPLNVSALALLLEYLYTGELASTREDDVRALVRFNEEQRQLVRDGVCRCGDEDQKWATLEDDVRAMLNHAGEARNGADAVLIFSNGQNVAAVASVHDHADRSATTEFETGDPGSRGEQKKTKCCMFQCHSLVLAARSSFFRAIIRKRRLQEIRRDGWAAASSSSSPDPLEIVLDESVIPRRYAPLLLRAMYTDEVDLSLAMRSCVASATSCLTEVQAIAAGRCQPSPVDEATEVYQIARFLEFDKLAQGCEDIIVSSMTLENAATIYGWAAESHGSDYVRRQCVDYLCQEFARFCTTPLLVETEEALLMEILKSDYVQASEADILGAVVRWGEHQLVRRIEEREPNILAGTAHSISRKGIKRADLSDEELKQILAGLMPLVRVDYVLPPRHLTLENAVARGLIGGGACEPESGRMAATVSRVQCSSRNFKDLRRYHSPSDLVRSCSSSATPEAVCDEADWSLHSQGRWCQPHQHTAGPRFFLPYLKEARLLLEKRLAESPEQLSSLINHHPPVGAVSERHFAVLRSGGRFPDALYMVDDGATRGWDDCGSLEIAVPPPETVSSLKERIGCIIRTSATVKRALACGCSYHRSGVLKQVSLRVIREFGLLDSTLTILEQSSRPSSSHSEHVSFCWPASPSLISSAGDWYGSRLNNSGSSATAEPRSPLRRRRIRSQPDLSQCDSAACHSVPVAWPDLMASSVSKAPIASFEDENSAGSPVGSYLRGAAQQRLVSCHSLAPTAASPNRTYPTSGHEHGRDDRQHLQLQWADLTRRICDLVAGEEQNDDRKDGGESSLSLGLERNIRRDTDV